MNSLLYITPFLLFGYFQTGDCIRCWECNSKYDPNCADPFKPHTLALVDCSQRILDNGGEPAEATICRKLTQKIRGEERIVRSCGYLSPHEAGTCFNRAGTHLVFSDYCQCAGDGCNTAAPLRHQTAAQVFLSTLLIALLYLFS